MLSIEPQAGPAPISRSFIEVAADLHDLQAQVFKARTARFNFFVVQQIRDAELHRKPEERLHQRSRFHIDQDEGGRSR